MNVDVVAGADLASSTVRVSGSFQHIITDAERTTFSLSDKQLKEAVDKYFGKKPNDAYLHSPTPWGDLYKSYSWEQVSTNVIPEWGQILSLTSKPTIVKSAEFKNSSSVPATFNVAISDEVTDTTSTNWSNGGEFSFSQTINYEVKFLGAGGGGESSMSYTKSWDKGGEKSTSVTVGSNSSVSVTLNPGQAVESVLSASRGVMKVRVQYSTYLSGRTAVNYNPTYKGHHFYGLPINSVMASAGISNSKLSTEDIEIDYFSNSILEVKDVNDGSVLASHSV